MPELRHTRRSRDPITGPTLVHDGPTEPCRDRRHEATSRSPQWDQGGMGAMVPVKRGSKGSSALPRDLGRKRMEFRIVPVRKPSPDGCFKFSKSRRARHDGNFSTSPISQLYQIAKLYRDSDTPPRGFPKSGSVPPKARRDDKGPSSFPARIPDPGNPPSRANLTTTHEKRPGRFKKTAIPPIPPTALIG